MIFSVDLSLLCGCLLADSGQRELRVHVRRTKGRLLQWSYQRQRGQLAALSSLSLVACRLNFPLGMKAVALLCINDDHSSSSTELIPD